jgi:hypothetical protein
LTQARIFRRASPKSRNQWLLHQSAQFPQLGIAIAAASSISLGRSGQPDQPADVMLAHLLDLHQIASRLPLARRLYLFFFKDGGAKIDQEDEQLDELIGFLMNTLAMRVGMRAKQTCRGLLGKVRKTALEAYQHQDIPF